jgi:hypothetical protein
MATMDLKHRKITIYAVILSVLYWLAESVGHRFVFSDEVFEIIPSDVNELWMRSLIIVLLIVFGFIADNQANRIRAAEKEKREIFAATLSSTQHVMNNLLNQLQLVLFEEDKAHALSDNTRKLLEKSIREGKKQMDRLSSVTKLDEETIRKSVEPK